MAYAGTWYALVYSNTTRTVSNYTFGAATSEVQVTGATPNRYATNATAVVTVAGAGFDTTTQVALVGTGGTIYPATAVQFDASTRLSATFNLTGVPQGVYSVQVTKPDALADTLSKSFTVTAPGAAQLQTHLVLPSALGRHATGTIYVEYTNVGNEAMSAPLLVLESGDPDGSDRPFLTLDQNRLVAGFWTSAMPAGFANSVQFIATGETPGVLQPGESGRIPVYYAGLQQPWDFSDTRVEFQIGVLNVTSSTAVDWNSLKDQMRPDYVTADGWNAVWSNCISQVGNTWGGYLGALDENAVYLANLGVDTDEITRLLAFEFRQADSLNPIRYLASGTDTSMTAPGMDLVFSRAYAQPISRRYEMGPLGYGWADNWQLSFVRESDGTVKITDMTGTPRIFQPDSRYAGQYLAATGDQGVLTAVAGGALNLREQDGTTYRFLADGKLDYVQDTNGNRITCSYTGGLLTALTHSSGQSITLAYNAAGRIISTTDSDGRQTTYTYDAANEHLLFVQDYDGRVTSYTYITGQGVAREHALSQIIYPGGSHRYYTYDAHGRLASTSVDGGAEMITFGYDSTGAVTATDALGNSSKFYFDDWGAILKGTNSLGNSVLLSMDDHRNVTSVIDPAGHSYLFQYDNNDNLTRFVDAGGHATSFTYTTDYDRLDLLTDANGNVTNYDYDADGNLTSITYADGTRETWAYDSLGQPTTWTNRRGTPVGFTFNADGQITRKTYADGTHVDYVYDARGNLTSATDASGTTTFTYDSHDYLTRIDYPVPTGNPARWLEFTYDTAGRRASSLDQLGHRLDYHYDAAGRLSSITDEAATRIVFYEYDPVGQIARKTLGNGVYTTYEYDAAGQLLHLVNCQSGGTILSRFDYAYDNRGRRTSMDTLDGLWTYQYDDIGQLTHAVFVPVTGSLVPAQDLLYVYDAMGNRVYTIENGIRTDYTTNNLNQYTRTVSSATGTTTYTFDADGNLIRETSSSGTTVYSYDAENRMVAVQQGTDAWNYTYGAFDQRVASSHNGTITQYMIDPIGLGNVVGEYDNAGGLTTRYDYGFGLLSRMAAGATAWYTFDAIGNTAALTDSNGNIVNSYAYQPFGALMHQTGGSPNPIQFVGEWGVIEEHDGLVFMRARNYSTALGRFLQADPIGLAGGLVLYGYAGNSPSTQSDPTGLRPKECGGANYEWMESGIHRVVVKDGYAYDFIPRWHWMPVSPGEWRRRKVLDKGNLGPEELLHSGWDTPYSMFGHNCLWGSEQIMNWFCGWSKSPPWNPDPDTGPGGEGSTGDPTSGDPNQKLGPVGFGTQSFIRSEGSFAYRIDFENDPTATAPAQIVTITDHLDANLDWSTFALTEITFGDYLLSIPAGLQHYQTTVPVTYNGKSFQVQIEAGINLSTGTVFANFYSIDPDTSLPPDVLIGFLPPEDGTGRGMGHIAYTVSPQVDLTTGTEIRNIAYIVFDGQPAIATNQVDPHDAIKGTDPTKECLNTIDAGAPTSNVVPLPANATGQDFTVAWTGQDDTGGSGIAGYDIYVSDNDGTWTKWLDDTSATSATFHGQWGQSYHFYSVATDEVGNEEAPPDMPDTVTAVPAVYTRTLYPIKGQNSWTFLDADGDRVTVTLKGKGGSLDLVRLVPADANSQGDLLWATASSSNTMMNITIAVKATTKGKVASTTLGSFSAPDGALGSLSAPSVNLIGNLTVEGSLGSLTLADVRQSSIGIGARNAGDTKTTSTLVFDQLQNVSIISATPFKSLTATEWLDDDATPDMLTAPSMDKLTITGRKANAKAGLSALNGDFQADLNLGTTGDGIQSLGTFVVAGVLDGSNILTNGRNAKGLSIGTFKAGFVAGATISAAGGISSVSTSQWQSGVINAQWIGSITTKANAALGGTGHWGADLTLTGAPANLKKSTLNSTSIAGDVLAGTYWDIQAGSAGTMAVAGTVRQSLIRSAGNIKNITVGATDGSDFGAGVALSILQFKDHIEAGDTPPQATISTFTVKGWKLPKGATIPRFFIDSCISAKVGKLTVTNWDELGGLYTSSGGVHSIKHSDTANKSNNWVWPILPHQSANGSQDFVHLIWRCPLRELREPRRSSKTRCRRFARWGR